MRNLIVGLLSLLAYGSVARADLKAVSPGSTVLTNLNQLPAIANGTVLGNSSGSTAAPSALTTLPDGLTLGATALFGGTWGSGSLTNNRAPIWQNVTFAGTTTNAAAAFGLFLQQSDNSSNTGYAGVAGVGVNEHLTVNGSSSVGQRIAGQFIVDSSAASGNVTDPQHIGLGSKCNMNTTDTPSGGSSCFGLNAVASANASITAKQIVGAEIDTWTQTGATIQDRIGAQIVDVTGATYGAQATRDDVSLTLNNQYAPSSSLGYKIGLEFGRTGGNFPVYTTGTMIYGQGNAGGGFTVAHGIDWHLGTFTTDSFTDGINSLTPTGPNTTQAYKISGNKILSLPNGSTTNIAAGLGAGGSLSGINNTIVGAGSGALLGAANSETLLGWGNGTQITTGSNNVIVGPAVASTTLQTGHDNVVIGTSNVCDTAASGSNNSLTLCAGGGALLRVTGGSTASTATQVESGNIQMPNLASSSAAQTGTVCWTTSTGNLTVDTTTTCLLSTARVKQHIKPLDAGLSELMRFRPVSYELKPQYDPGHLGRQVGLISEEVGAVDDRLISHEKDGAALGVRYQQLTAVLIKSIQEQQAEIEELRTELHRKRRAH